MTEVAARRRCLYYVLIPVELAWLKVRPQSTITRGRRPRRVRLVLQRVRIVNPVPRLDRCVRLYPRRRGWPLYRVVCLSRCHRCWNSPAMRLIQDYLMSLIRRGAVASTIVSVPCLTTIQRAIAPLVLPPANDTGCGGVDAVAARRAAL